MKDRELRRGRGGSQAHPGQPVSSPNPFSTRSVFSILNLIHNLKSIVPLQPPPKNPFFFEQTFLDQSFLKISKLLRKITPPPLSREGSSYLAVLRSARISPGRNHLPHQRLFSPARTYLNLIQPCTFLPLVLLSLDLLNKTPQFIRSIHFHSSAAMTPESITSQS